MCSFKVSEDVRGQLPLYNNDTGGSGRSVILFTDIRIYKVCDIIKVFLKFMNKKGLGQVDYYMTSQLLIIHVYEDKLERFK